MSQISSNFKLSKKQLEFYQTTKSRQCIAVGAVRSGKSFIALLRWLLFLIEGPKGDLVICARTERAALRNIISPLHDLLGDSVSYQIGRGLVKILGREMHVISCADARCEQKIRGSTLAGALVDEASIIPEDFIKMLLSRLSIPGAQCFMTTNPDSPYCYLKKDIIDREDELDLQVFNFTLDDNPSLSQEYKDNICKEYRGLYYKRFILGEWCQAEGAVYDFFDEKLHTIKYPPGYATKYIVGIDYGTTNNCCFVLIGINRSLYPHMWLEKEYVYSSRENMRQKTDSEYAEDFKDFLNGITPHAIYIDPSAASFKQELIRQGVPCLMDADNNVLDGIRYVANLLSNGTFKISTACRNSIREFQSYCWDEKASSKGIDRVKKVDDHCFVAGTRVITSNGYENIENIKSGDYVLTREGYKRVYGTWKSKEKVDVVTLNVHGKKIVCTPNHNFITANRGKVPASNLTQSDTLYIIEGKTFDQEWKKSQSSGMGSLIQDTQNLKIYPMHHILEEAVGSVIYTGIYGNTIMGKSQMGIIFTILMGIPQIMISKICNVFQKKNIVNYTRRIYQKRLEKEDVSTVIPYDILQKNGILQMKGKRGIGNMLKGLFEKSFSKSIRAYVAVKNFLLRNMKLNFVRTHVNQNIGEQSKQMMSRESVSCVVKNSLPINIERPNVVQLVAKDLLCQKEEKKEVVYNLTIEEENEYFVEGILVANCMDAIRYALYTGTYNEPETGSMTERDAYLLERKYSNGFIR